MIMNIWGAVGIGLMIAIPGNWYANRNPLFGCWYYGFWAVICPVLTALNAAQGSWKWAAITAACAALNAWSWWRSRNNRRRKRAPRALGAKSRARVAALVRKAREATRPRRTVPGAAPVLAVVLLAACGTSTVHARPAIQTAPAAHCGLERWPVKTGTDPGAASVDLTTVVPSTIAALAALPPPSVLPQDARVAPVEDTVYQVTGTLTEFKIEADQDIHAVVADAGQTMIVEIPDSACVGQGSPFLPGITAARAAFTQRYTPSAASFTHVSVPVTVTGVGFFDPEHGQTGGAVLQGGQVTIELHPVLSIQFGQAP